MPITKEQVEQAIIVIEKRLNSMGTAEPMIARQGVDGIIVQMPGVEPEVAANIRATLEKVAKLELREVNMRGYEPGPDGKTLAQRVMDGDEIVPGYRAYNYVRKNEDGVETSTRRSCSTAAWRWAVRTSPMPCPRRSRRMPCPSRSMVMAPTR